MTFLSTDFDNSLLEKEVKNRWKWCWLQEESSDGTKVEVWCKKVDISGTCFCVPCGKTLSYGHRGKKALLVHADDKTHRTSLAEFSRNEKLSGASQSLAVTLKRLGDRVCELKAVTCASVAEHCLPFTVAPQLVDFARRLSEYKQALNALSISRQSATYTTTHGVAHAFTKELNAKLHSSFFSLNIDEATNNSNDKIVNVMVQYYDEELQKSVVDHFGSKEVNIATSENIFQSVSTMMEERELKWNQVVSCLMDNCNTMRGSKKGVETLIRKANNCLLDISGETVHMIHTSASYIFAEMDKKFIPLQDLAGKIYYDIHNSPKSTSVFEEIQQHLLGVRSKPLIRPISNRFLQMEQVADRIHVLFDSLLVYYSAFLTADEQKKMTGEINHLLEKHGAPTSSVSKIKAIINDQKKQARSSMGDARKEFILLYLFHKRKQTYIAVQLYRGIIAEFSTYAKMFQSEKPMVHKLHAEIFHLIKQFYSHFIDAAHLPLHDAHALANLDPMDMKIQLKDRQLGVGEHNVPLKECLRDTNGNPWLSEFFSALRSGYMKSVKSLKKLPLLNKCIVHLSALDPGMQKSSATSSSLMKLAESLPNVVPANFQGKLDDELRMYTCDSEVTQLNVDETSPDFRLDTDWWVKVFQLKTGGVQRYPTLSVLVKALLSIFSGPLVEGSFNIMGDIIEEDRSKLSLENYEGIAMIKQRLKVTKKTATTMEVNQAMVRSVQTSWQRYSDFQDKKSKKSLFWSCPAATRTDNSAPTGQLAVSHILQSASKSDKSSQITSQKARSATTDSAVSHILQSASKSDKSFKITFQKARSATSDSAVSHTEVIEQSHAVDVTQTVTSSVELTSATDIEPVYAGNSSALSFISEVSSRPPKSPSKKRSTSLKRKALASSHDIRGFFSKRHTSTQQ